MDIEKINIITEKLKNIKTNINDNNSNIEKYKNQIFNLRKLINNTLKNNIELFNKEKKYISELHKESYNLYTGTKKIKYPPGLEISIEKKIEYKNECSKKNNIDKVTLEKYTKNNSKLKETPKESILEKDEYKDKKNVWENKDKIDIIKNKTILEEYICDPKKKLNISLSNEKEKYFQKSIIKLNKEYCPYGKRCQNPQCEKKHNTCFFYHRYGQCLAGFYCTFLHIDELLLNRPFNRKNFNKQCIPALEVVKKYGSLRNDVGKNPSMEYYPIRTRENNNKINILQPLDI